MQVSAVNRPPVSVPTRRTVPVEHAVDIVSVGETPSGWTWKGVARKITNVGATAAVVSASAMAAAYGAAMLLTPMLSPTVAACVTGAVLSGGLGILEGRAICQLATGPQRERVPGQKRTFGEWKDDQIKSCGKYAPLVTGIISGTMGAARGMGFALLPGFGHVAAATLAFASSYGPGCVLTGSLMSAGKMHRERMAKKAAETP